mmetsp:Transcript_29917/g.71871  ORF Transcript_29917/g.71871 Transcript_29917/m.71871 type:complete len:280 (+) Transcript_29917:102-941(+)|eukprot:CAMPEP_0113633886 /NCGR_PEP_ID=MMETSP0017_2-20120614/17639_1 /TAXON_ID=2856 /ORGANISM="Cylindrotheca closterium" /LENGTH=279 /DNA_ID=CAMNT_0000544551 /DNA_START=91 /DNA_END=930 /DNA_ORIENTATION=- /assembly_acc=CAM_ASM_000147
MGGRKCDPFCYLAAILFFGSGVIRTVLFDQPISSAAFEYKSWIEMDGYYIKQQWTGQRSLIMVLWATYSAMHVLGWVIVATILFRFAWIQSANGTTKIGVNGTIAFLGATTAIVELVVRMLFHGSSHAQSWIAESFTLDKWYALEDMSSGEVDRIGWKTLEVVSIASTGFLIWADTIEYMALVVILVLMHNSTTVAGSLFSKSWAFFGVLIACLNVFDIAAEILRFQEWQLFGHIAMYLSSANQIFIFPIWLIWMGVQLAAVPKMNQSVEVPDDLALDE